MYFQKNKTWIWAYEKKGGGMKRSRDRKEVGIDLIQGMKGEKKKKTIFNNAQRDFCKFDYKLSTFDLNHLPNLQQILLLAWLHLKPQCIHPFHALLTRAHTPNNKTSASPFSPSSTEVSTQPTDGYLSWTIENASR